MDSITKNRDWLKNSTYKSCDIEQFDSDENCKTNNDFLASSSDSNDNNLRISHKKKKRKHKKINKRKIVKHYLNSLPSISDEKCHFRNYNFLEQMPKEERSNNFFVDVKGNCQISRYGCIYEKHVSKYRSQTDKKQGKSDRSERYYEKLKSLKNGDCFMTIEKRLCDSRCICHQSFIPVPFDINVDMVEQNHVDHTIDKEYPLMLNEATILNETVKKDPHNIDAWIRLVNLQSEKSFAQFVGSNSTSNSSSVVTERQLLIIEKALGKNQSNLQLQLLRMTIGGQLWPIDRLQKEWNQLIFVHNTNIDVWRFYIEQMSRQIIGHSVVDKMINIYTKCFSTFFNIMSGRTRVKMIEPDTIYDLCDLFADYCDYLTQSGFSERATASWQAMMEYNFFCPPNSKPKSSGNLLDDPMLQSFQQFWQTNQPLFGHPDARGWFEWCDSMKNNIIPSSIKSYSLLKELQQNVSDIECSLLDGNDDETTMWLKLEQSRIDNWWLPETSYSNEMEDCDRHIPFLLVQPVLITLHDLQNVTDHTQSSQVSLKAKNQLLVLFFDFFDVSYCRLSMDNELIINRIRQQQLRQMPLLSVLLSPSNQTKNLSQLFIDCCFDQLMKVVNQGVNQEATQNVKQIAMHDDELRSHCLSILNLSHKIKLSNKSSTDSWKQMLASVKSGAKTVLLTNGDNPLLWSTYAQLLIDLLNHELINKSDKARTVVINETLKVVQPLMQQICSSSMDINRKLEIVCLSIDLIIKTNRLHCNGAIVTEIINNLWIAVQSVVVMYNMVVPVDVTAFNAVEILSHSVNLVNVSVNNLDSHWYQLIYLTIVAQLLVLDLEKFQLWITEECLLTITGIGSSCLWSQQFLGQLSILLESMTSFIAWFYRSQSRNDSAIIRTVLTPFIHVLVQIQSGIKKPIIEHAISPKLVHNCIGNSAISEGQRFKLRNFLWNLIGSFETQNDSEFNHNCHASSLLLLNMEINRLDKLITSNISDCNSVAVFSGRVDRVRSAFNRLINFNCMHWRYRLAMWHSFILLESLQTTSPKRDERTKGIFYRAITEMPGQKSLYLTIVSLVPNMLEEVTMLMKNNHVRTCAPLEEVKLLIRIRQSRQNNTNNPPE